jgi:hypothetical protein
MKFTNNTMTIRSASGHNQTVPIREINIDAKSISGGPFNFRDWDRPYRFTADQQGSNHYRGNWQCEDRRTGRIECRFTGGTVDGDWYETGGRCEFTIQLGAKVD